MDIKEFKNRLELICLIFPQLKENIKAVKVKQDDLLAMLDYIQGDLQAIVDSLEDTEIPSVIDRMFAGKTVEGGVDNETLPKCPTCNI